MTPPPTLTTEVVEWLSPEPEEDGDLVMVFEDPAPFNAAARSAAPAAEDGSLMERAVTAVRRLFRLAR